MVATPGRLTLRQRGVFYTPAFVADWLARRVVGALESEPQIVLDPACGDGALLEAFASLNRGRGRLVGFDLDPNSLREAQSKLGSSFTGQLGDSLMMPPTTGVGEALADVVVANPPWGGELPSPRSTYQSAGFGLAVGQFDPYDLFIERCLQSLRPGGMLGLVLPDSLFLPEHEATRRLLLDRTQLIEIARLGEGVFPGVFRGTVLVVARHASPRENTSVRCSRLHYGRRRAVIRGDLDLEHALDSHRTPQRRFVENPNAEFDLDVASEDGLVEAMRRRSGFPWGQLVGGRGAEIGKAGLVWQCPRCGTARPVPRSVATAHCVCGNVLDSSHETRVIEDSRLSANTPSFAPLVVGSDVRRYEVTPSRSLRLGVRGLRYKPVPQSLPKLLIRKTGVGIQAGIDCSGAQTVQTVFHYYASEESNNDLIYYLLGIINSRLLQALHLRLSGDSEWRSHPYVTPRVIQRLPIPNPADDPALARAIAQLASVLSSDLDTAEDARLDALVAEMYGLGEDALDWALGVLRSAQRLRSIAVLLPDESEQSHAPAQLSF